MGTTGLSINAREHALSAVAWARSECPLAGTKRAATGRRWSKRWGQHRDVQLRPALRSPAPRGYRRASSPNGCHRRGWHGEALPQSGGRATLAGYSAKRRILGRQPSTTACRTGAKRPTGRRQRSDRPHPQGRKGAGAGRELFCAVQRGMGTGCVAASREITARTGFPANTASGGAEP